MSKEKVNYQSSGRQWKWGWHRYESRTMVIIIAIVTVLSILGAFAGISLATAWAWPIYAVILLAIGFFILAAIIGFAIFKIVINPIWSFLTTKGMED
jgi:hypothetical protein